MTTKPHVYSRQRLTFQVEDADAAALNAIIEASRPFRLTYSEAIRFALREAVAALPNPQR